MSKEMQNDGIDADCLIDEAICLSTAREAVESWGIAAVGCRTEDYLVRDFYFGSLFRDPRPRYFHENSQNPSQWMRQLASHLPYELQQVAHLHAALNYLHQRHVLQVLEASATDIPDDNVKGQLDRLVRCPPYGVKVAHEKPDLHRDVCHQAWLCPWCLGRRLSWLNDELRRCLKLDRGKDRYLLLGRARVFREQLGIEPQAHLQRDEIALVRRAVGDPLRQLASTIGVSGGIMTYQLGPDKLHGCPSFRHELAVLGELAIASDAKLEQIKQAIGANGPPCPSLEIGEASLPVRFWLLPADNTALRILLAGTSHGYPVYNLYLSATRDQESGFEPSRDGIPGVFALQPLFMLGVEQWKDYAVATKNLRMWDAFGTWKDLPRVVGKIPYISREEWAASRQRQPLHRANHAKHSKAEHKQAMLFQVAEPLWRQLQEKRIGSTSHRGRPAEARLLRELLSRAGVDVSDWELRELMKSLRSSSQNGKAQLMDRA